MKLCLRDVQRRFDRAAASFDQADFVHAATRDGLFERIAPLVVDARRVLDLGSATGSAGPRLGKRFRGAEVLSLDLSRAMLAENRRKAGWFSRPRCVQARAEALPFADDSLDVVFANQLLPWVTELADVLDEVARVLRPEGLFAFATMGPDTLRELANAWGTVDEYAHVHHFSDMHDVGDALLRSGLRDPVLDVDRLDIRYDDIDRLWSDLTRMGARNALLTRKPSMTGRKQFSRMIDALRSEAGGSAISFDLEVVYGHCWGASGSRRGADFRIDAASIGRRGR